MEKRRILFVDDDPNALRGLERMLHCMRQKWDMEFTTQTRHALKILATAHFDVVVADIRGEGRLFLAKVMRQYPHIVRIILSGHADKELTLEALIVSHQLVAKPCDVDTLKAAISGALALRKLLEGDTPLKALVSRLESLPSLPSLYIQLVEELQSPNASVKTVAKIIAQDPAMVAKTLQLVNSAFFGLRRRISNVSQAIGLLGLETIKTLVLVIQVFSQFDAATLKAFSIESLWRHSMTVGTLARRIAEAEGGGEGLGNDAFAAGLLHDIGKLILATNLSNIYVKAMTLVEQEGICLTEAERRLFGAAHAETGAYLLGLWGLPEAVVEAVAYHHHPRDCETLGFSALTAVHAANALSHEFALDPRLSTPDPLDQAYLEALHLNPRVKRWRNICHRLVLLMARYPT